MDLIDDPLAIDTPAPRHALESDDEEEELNPLSAPSSSITTEKPKLELKGDIGTDGPLIVASGPAGEYWAKGTNLGEQIAGIYVNDIQIGLVFSLDGVNVVISEARRVLPIPAMSTYAKFLLDSFRPSSVSFLATYATSTYISTEPIPAQGHAPLRYLTTIPEFPHSDLLPFSPPNILTHTTAALLSHASLPTSKTNKSATTILLPTIQSPPTPPKEIGAPAPHTAGPEWLEATMRSTEEALFQSVGLTRQSQWKLPAHLALSGGAILNRLAGDVGEGGMYI